ncbi:YebC/PmpR family DNA-binding regulatory protein [Hypnocyclicus thermotrophus]|uniref:Probable transcriptional regulatory protein EV215_1850 n=1 Tax=Hypnocyclicus thermotrophus TaxID=1627895 RepID=A0AA46I4V6_9FUSO|nr:YebC/PmpR family DNA-binding transcriptional regulator [Hypnocyclicus thermotrophus]TDT67847.1 YebC/PmpR family DNA-binding regulatory protein [Hypnocyclicus thermotrophus]
MAGHSKWANIQHRKGRQDKARAKLFTKLAKELTIAARDGGGDPNFNPRLRLALDKAKAGNMPKDNIERAIKKGTGEIEGVEYFEIRYEGYGPSGVAFIVDVVTDNKNRTASTVRSNFSKNNGNLGESGSVSWMFHRKGVLTFSNVDEEKIMELALESGAEDIIENGDNFLVYTAPEDFENIKKALEDNELVAESAEITFVPENEIDITDEETAKQVLKLYEALEDNEDVQEVYANFNIPDELMEKLMN